MQKIILCHLGSPCSLNGEQLTFQLITYYTFFILSEKLYCTYIKIYKHEAIVYTQLATMGFSTFLEFKTLDQPTTLNSQLYHCHTVIFCFLILERGS